MGIGDNYLKLFIYSLDFNMVISLNLVPSPQSWDEVEFRYHICVQNHWQEDSCH